MRMRNDLLERQAKETRVKMISLVEKTSVDDQLIDALRKELGKKVVAWLY